MIKTELIKKLAEKSGLKYQDAKFVVEKTFSSIAEALKQGERVELRGFGVFIPRKKSPRRSRNPKTGQPITTSETFIIRFKAGKDLKDRIK